MEGSRGQGENSEEKYMQHVVLKVGGAQFTEIEHHSVWQGSERRDNNAGGGDLTPQTESPNRRVETHRC